MSGNMTFELAGETMNHDLAPIPAFASPTPPSDGELDAMLARAQAAGIAPERVLLALGYPLPEDAAERPTRGA